MLEIANDEISTAGGRPVDFGTGRECVTCKKIIRLYSNHEYCDACLRPLIIKYWLYGLQKKHKITTKIINAAAKKYDRENKRRRSKNISML